MPFSVERALGYLSEAYSRGRLAHAFLFSGPEGSGKRRLVADFFRAINGQTTDSADFHQIEPESKSRKILVEQIRALENSLRMRAVRAKAKFGVVYEADRLMPQAANAFLKTLEEPPDHSVLVLVTMLPEALFDTIRSRCIQVPLRAPATQWLTKEEAELLAELSQIMRVEGFSIVTALRLVRVFQEALRKVREVIETEHGDLLLKDEAVYKQTTDGTWLEEREERLSVRTESRYIKARADLVLRMIEWFGDAVRTKQQSPFLDLVEYRTAVADFAERVTTFELVKRLGALQSLIDCFSRNVQETLAIEVAFLRAFGPAP